MPESQADLHVGSREPDTNLIQRLNYWQATSDQKMDRGGGEKE